MSKEKLIKTKVSGGCYSKENYNVKMIKDSFIDINDGEIVFNKGDKVICEYGLNMNYFGVISGITEKSVIIVPEFYETKKKRLPIERFIYMNRKGKRGVKENEEHNMEYMMWA